MFWGEFQVFLGDSEWISVNSGWSLGYFLLVWGE